MDARHDAGLAAAAAALRVEEIAAAEGGVGTVGEIGFEPGIPTAVPGRASMVVDLRNRSADALGRDARGRRARRSRPRARGGAASCRRSRSGGSSRSISIPELVALAREACERVTGTDYELPSGALHDAASMAPHLPTAMVFSPSIAGVSHAPEEDTAEPDLRRRSRPSATSSNAASQLQADSRVGGRGAVSLRRTRLDMAGVASQPHGSASVHARSLVALASPRRCSPLLLIGGRSGAPSAAQAQVSCPAQPRGLSPATSGPAELHDDDPDQHPGERRHLHEARGRHGRPGPSPGHLRAQHPLHGQRPVPGDDLRRCRDLAADLRATFPCNRIIALNGMSFDPTEAGYRLLRDRRSERLRAAHRLRADRLELGAGHRSRPGRPGPTTSRRPSRCCRGWNFGFTSTVAANPVGAGKRTGLAPQDNATWNFGQIAQNLNKQNARLGDTQDRPDERADAGQPAPTAAPRASARAPSSCGSSTRSSSSPRRSG